MYTQVLALVSLTARSGADRAVIDAARTLALGPDGQPGGRVHLLHVVEPRGARGRRSAPVDAPLLHEAAAALAAEGVEVVVEVRAGRVPEVLARVVDDEEIDVVVLGRDAAGWGDHGRRALRAATVPVLVMPEGTTLGRGRVVVGMDLSASALRAWSHVQPWFAAAQPVAVVDARGEQADAAAVRTELEGAWHAAVGMAAPALHVVRASRPADALLDAAAGADLLVVGSRGLSPLAAALLGSTAESLAQRSPVPLLVQRDPHGPRHAAPERP